MRSVYILRACMAAVLITCPTIAGAETVGAKVRFSMAGMTVTVAGRVTDATTGRPLADALVRGHITVWRHLGPELHLKAPYEEAQTDSDGRYTLQFVTPLTTSGQFKGKDGICIDAGKAGYETRPLYVWPKVSPSHTAYTDVNLALRPGKRVSGIVVDEDGRPVEGALVRVQNGGNGDWNYHGSMGKAVTGPSGSFEIWGSTEREEGFGLSARSWLRIAKRGYGSAVYWDLHEKPSMGTLVLPRGATVTGRVVDTDGRPVANCEVSVRDNWPNVHDVTRTDAQGRYKLTGVPRRDALVRFYKRKNKRFDPVWGKVILYARSNPEASLKDVPQQKIYAPAGDEYTAPDLIVGSAVSVAGRLLPGRTTYGTDGLMVRLDSDWGRMVTVDGQGRFNFPIVMPGEHRLTAYLPNNLRGDRGIGRATINVEPGEPVENVEIKLEPMVEVRVRFVDADGNPIEGVTAGATWRKDGSGFWTEGTKSDAGGRAVLHLHPGSKQYVRGFDRSERKLIAEGGVAVSPKIGQVIENLRIAMVPPATVRGTLLGTDGKPLAEQQLIYRLDYADGASQREDLRTEADGQFELTGLTPGAATLTIDTTPADPIPMTVSTGEPVELAPGQSRDVGRIQLAPVRFHKVTGRLVRSPTFASLEGLKVRLGLRQWKPMVATDASGQFTIPKVREGKHRLTAYLPHNLRTDRGVGHVNITVTDQDVTDVELPLETLATIHVRLVDEEGNPIEGAFAGAWWNEKYAGVFTEGTASDKDGKSTLYMYPNQRQYVAAGDWRKRYRPKSNTPFTLKPGQVVSDHTVIMVRQPEVE